MVITNEILKQGMSYKGGYSLKQLRCLLPQWEFPGKGRFPSKGWKNRIIGCNIPEKDVKRFLSLRNFHHTESLFEDELSKEYMDISKNQVKRDCFECIHFKCKSCLDTLPDGCECYDDTETIEKRLKSA